MTAAKATASGADSAKRLANLDDLRGVAALAVCLFHLDGADASGLKWLTRLGFLGVYVFFVISGFILPHTMYRQAYHLRDFARFMMKRLARLYPPYLASLAMILILAVISSGLPGFQGERFAMDGPRLVTNLTYTAGIFGKDWYSPVSWTLGLEFQYYLLIALIFPLLVGRVAWLRLVVWGLLGCCSFLGTAGAWVMHYLPLFLLGIWAFWHEMNLCSRFVSWVLFAATLGLCWMALGIEGMSAAGATALVIVGVNASWGPLRLLGVISYSLYLIHLTFYHYAERLRDRSFPKLNEHLFQGLLLAGAILAAWVFYLVVEKPSIRLASSIRYSCKSPAAT